MQLRFEAEKAEGIMASKQSEQLVDLYKGWTAALAANPDMPLDETRAMFEH